MSGLIRSPNLRDPDGFYAALVTAHQSLSDEASELLNARLVLILANHIGDPDVLREALTLARATLAAGNEPSGAALVSDDRPPSG